MSKPALIFLLAIFFGFQSFDLKQGPVKNLHYELKDGDVVDYNHDSVFFSKGLLFATANYKRGSFDGTSFEIEADKSGSVVLKNRKSCPNRNQSELSIFRTHGNLFRVGDTLKIWAGSGFKKVYLFSLDPKEMVDSFSNEVKIDLVSKTYKGAYCPNLVRFGTSLEVIALPNGVKTKKIYVPIHGKNTIGTFTYFSIRDSKGKRKSLPQGDYIIFGGNTLSELK